MEKKFFCSLFSGGKDSTAALFRAVKTLDARPLLLSMMPARDDSFMYHSVNINLAPHLAEAMDMPIRTFTTRGVPPEENEDLKNALADLKKKYEIETLVSGAVSSNYQFGIIREIAEDLGISFYAPYWQKNHADLIRECLASGFKIIFTSVSSEGLDASWLGRELDSDALKDLEVLSRKYGINIGGEGGDYETLVTDCPLFKKKIEIADSHKFWDGVRGQLIIEKIRIVASR